MSRHGAAHSDLVYRSILACGQYVYDEDSKEDDIYDPHDYPRY